MPTYTEPPSEPEADASQGPRFVRVAVVLSPAGGVSLRPALAGDDEPLQQ